MVTHKVSQHFCGQRVSLEPWFYFLLLLRMSDLDFQISAASELIASGHHVCPPQPNPASLYLKSAFVRAIWTPKQTSHFNSLLQQQHIWGEKKPKPEHNISHNYNSQFDQRGDWQLHLGSRWPLFFGKEWNPTDISAYMISHWTLELF